MCAIRNQWIFIALSANFRCFITFFHKTDFQCFQTLSISGTSGFLPIACPAKPAITLYMGAVINVVIICHISCQTDLNGLKAFRLTGCSGKFTIFLPPLPANRLHVSLVFDSAFVFTVRQFDLNGFHSFSLTSYSGLLSVKSFALPADGLGMSIIRNNRILVTVTFTFRRCCSLFYNTDLNSFQTFRIPQTPGLFSVACPVKPSITLHMGSVVNIIFICQCTCQTDLNSFQSLSLASCSGSLSVLLPVLPAIALHVGTVLNSILALCTVNFKFQRFQTFCLAFCSDPCIFLILGPFIPAVALHMCTIHKYRGCRLFYFSGIFRISAFACISFVSGFSGLTLILGISRLFRSFLS